MAIFSAPTELVLLGAGHAHVDVLRRLAAQPIDKTRITLVSREPHTPYSGMLPGLIRGEYDFDAAHIDLRRLARAAGVRLLIATADGLDMVNRTVRLAGRPALPFDLLSVNIGGAPATAGGTGTPVKPIGQLLARLAEIEPSLHPGARLAVVGAGAGGTELALALARRLAGQVRIALICAGATPVPEAPARARAAIRDALVDAGIEVLSGVRAGAFHDGQLALSDGSSLDVVAALWANGATAAPFLAACGLGCDGTGAIQVDAGLRSLTHPFVYAAGDCASMRGQERPKAGVWAVRAGPHLTANLRRAVIGQPPRPWRPQHTALVILGLGNGRAIGWRNGLSHAGPAVWRWKDRIDQRWMTRYRLPTPKPAAPPAWQAVRPPMADATLAAVRADLLVLPPARHPHGATVSQAVSHHAMFLDDPFVFGQIAAASALAALPEAGAKPWTATATVAWPRLSSHPGGGGTADLTAMLHGAAGVLAAEGCALTTLHMEAGDMLALTLAVNFLQEPGQAMAAIDLRAGDALVLTKPLGAGIVLAADRRGLAKARWLTATLAAMRRPNGKAATVLRGHGAICWTGIGPRGLAAELALLLGPTGLTARLDPDGIPALPGARELAAIGVADPAAQDNRIDLPGNDAVTHDPVLAGLVADPQLSGGLLAAVAPTYVDSCIAALRQAGHAGAVIGHIQAADIARPALDTTDFELVVAG